MPRLKVFRTSIGFHDAYVATPSRKAALEAWGTKRNLFASSLAEEVTDPALTEQPLAQPGTVIRRSRGSRQEQFASLGPTEQPDERAKSNRTTPATKPKPQRKPNRVALEKAEQALQDAQAKAENERAALREREIALAAERKALEARHSADITRLERRVERERDKYRAKLNAAE